MTNRKQVKNNDNAELEFKIGQVVYILSNKSTKIVPGVVSEELIVKTLNESKVQWKLLIGPPDKRKTVEIENIDGEIFSSLEEIQAELDKRSKAFLLQSIQEAKSRVKGWYRDCLPQAAHGHAETKSSHPKQSIDDGLFDPETVTDVEEKEEVIHKLKTLVTPAPHEEEKKNNEGEIATSKSNPEKIIKMVKMPDGSSVPVEID